MKAEQAAYVARQVDNFGGKFGVRGPHSLYATADFYATAEAKLNLRRHEPAVREYSDYVVPVSVVSADKAGSLTFSSPILPTHK